MTRTEAALAMAREVSEPPPHSVNCKGCEFCLAESSDKRPQWEKDLATGARDPAIGRL